MLVFSLYTHVTKRTKSTLKITAIWQNWTEHMNQGLEIERDRANGFSDETQLTIVFLDHSFIVQGLELPYIQHQLHFLFSILKAALFMVI